jgi:hypothetical protein
VYLEVEYLAEVATGEGLDIMGAVGSLDGGELSYKVNRELGLVVGSTVIYERLLEISCMIGR